MGFGLLVIGYIVTFIMSLTLYGWLIRLVGYLIMAVACIKLKDYFPIFRYPVIILAALFISGGFEAVCEIFGAAGWAQSAEAFNGYIRFALQLVYQFVLLISVSISAATVGLTEKRLSAVTDMSAVSLAAVFYLLAVTRPAFGGVAVLFGLVSNIMVIVLLFSCYMRICPEGDEDMPRGKSRIPFVDKINDSMEKRNLSEMEKSKAEIAARRRALAERNEKKSKKNKK